MKLYENIKARREELNMTQEELAFKLGYKSRSTINKIELGKSDIPQSKIKAFADALQTTPSALMGWEDEMPQHEESEGYYISEDVAEYAQELARNKDLRMLFDAARHIKKEDMQLVYNMIKRFKDDAE